VPQIVAQTTPVTMAARPYLPAFTSGPVTGEPGPYVPVADGVGSAVGVRVGSSTGPLLGPGEGLGVGRV
jgi:hypothetical protein